MGLWVYAVRGIVRRPGRWFLTLAGVSIGVATAVAASIAIETARGHYRELFEGLSGHSALEVYAPGDGGFDPAEAETLGRLKGIRAAIPEILGMASLRWRKIPIPVLVVGRKHGSDEPVPEDDKVLVASGLAELEGLTTGDRVPFWGPVGQLELTVSGKLPAPTIPGPADALTVVVSLATAQQLFALESKVNRIRLILEEQADLSSVESEALKHLTPGLSIRAPAMRSDMTRSLQAAAVQGLTGLTAIALVGAGYVVFGIVQFHLLARRQEFAILRALGASSAQIEGIFLRQSLLLGLAGAVLGTVVGFLLAVLVTHGTSVSIGVTVTEPRIGWSHAILGVAIGLLLSMCAVWLPARSLCRCSALALFGPTPQISGTIFSSGQYSQTAATFCLASGMWVLADCSTGRLSALTGQSLFPVALGFVLLGMTWLTSPWFPRVIVWLEQPVASFFGVNGVVAVRQLERRPERTSRTAGVVFVVVAMAVGFGHTVLNTLADVRGWAERAIPADFLVRGSMPDPSFVLTAAIPESLGDELSVLGGIDRVDRIAFIQTRVEGQSALVLSRTFPTDLPLPLDLRGSDSDTIRRGLAAGEAVFGDGLARKLNVRVGDVVSIDTPGGPRPIRVAGTVSEYAGGGGALYVDWSRGQSLFGANGVHAFLVTARDGQQANVSARLTVFCRSRGLLLQENRDVRKVVDDMTRGLTAGLWTILAIMFVVAGLGVANAIAVGVREQGRDVEILRAVGMLSHCVRKTFRLQAFLLLFAGLTGGILAGIVLALMLNRSVQGLWGYRVPFCLEPLFILGVVGLTILTGTLTDFFTPVPRGVEK